MPADIVGTLIYNPQSSDFVVKKGPVFANIVLADEINRASVKVQSALLEAMQERHVTVGDTTYGLPDPFLVMATQNPIEQEGTYPLPEAQTKYNAVLNSFDAGQEEKFIALYSLGNTEYGKKDFRKAVGSYKEALKLKPCDKDAKYNLEVALLKLNEKDSYQNDNDSNSNKQDSWQKGQNGKQNDQNAGNRQQSKEKHDLKRQMEQNDKAQKENEKKRQSPGVKDEIQKRQNLQKDLEEEKLKLEKQRFEISNKIKALKKAGATKNKFSEHKNRFQWCNLLGDKSEKERQYGVLEMQSA